MPGVPPVLSRGKSLNPVIPSTITASAQQSLHSPAQNSITTNVVGNVLPNSNVPLLPQNNNSSAAMSTHPVAGIGSSNTPVTPGVGGLLNSMVAPNVPVSSLSNITPGLGSGGVGIPSTLNASGSVGLPSYPINSNLDVVLPPQQPAKIKKGVKRKADTTTPTATSFDSPYVNTDPKTPKTATRNAGRQVSY